jgi:hypothetical protein
MGEDDDLPQDDTLQTTEAGLYRWNIISDNPKRRAMATNGPRGPPPPGSSKSCGRSNYDAMVYHRRRRLIDNADALATELEDGDASNQADGSDASERGLPRGVVPSDSKMAAK